MTEDITYLSKILMPHANNRIERAKKHNTRFAHYTSSDTALKILNSQTIWLRNSLLMNDFSEIQYGWNCINNVLNNELGKELNTILKDLNKTFPDSFRDYITQLYDSIRDNTYLISISEHGHRDRINKRNHEDRFGRLSMWRAYAPKDGVAFVLHNTPLLSDSTALPAVTSPVLYATPQEFEKRFNQIIHNVKKNISTIKNGNIEQFMTTFAYAIQFAVQSTKHPSFSEEKEWRVIYSPKLVSTNPDFVTKYNNRVHEKILSVKGVAQKIYSIPLKDYPEDNFIGATIPDLIDRVLIGPSAHSYAIYDAIASELEKLNVPNAREKVVITDIPFRQI